MYGKPWIIAQLRRVVRRYALRNLQANESLWREVRRFKDHSPSTGCSWSDLWVLYDTVRKRRPREILELGPGLSTVVLAHALIENEREGYPGRITAMEELEFYLDSARALLPDQMRPYVDYHLSPRVDDVYQIFRGVAYRDVPDRPYDFVFVDGPEHHSPTDGEFAFDIDFINVVKRSEQPVYGIVDLRLTSSFVFQTVFGPDKVKFDAVRELCFVGPCRRDDLLQLELDRLGAVMMRQARIVGNTRLQLR